VRRSWRYDVLSGIWVSGARSRRGQYGFAIGRTVLGIGATPPTPADRRHRHRRRDRDPDREPALSDVFVIAVLASLDAGLIAAAVLLLARPRPARKLLAFLLGCMGFSIVFGLVIVLALHGSKLVREPSPAVSATIEIAAGALLFVVAVAAVAGRNVHWHPRRGRGDKAHRPERRSLSDRALGHDSLWIAWAAGALYSVPGAYYLAGMALLVKLDAPTTTDVLAIVGFNLIMFAFIELPLLGFLIAPERARTLTGRLNNWMKRNKRTLITAVAGIGGIYLLVSGLSDLP
jgi:Sap, sulfolipid-1-addressing protein